MPDASDRFKGNRPPGDDLLAQGVDLFNKGYFFEAHDVWEEVWTLDRTPARKFYQGLIKVAGGFHHFQNGNYIGSAALLTAGLEHLAPYAAGHGGIDLAGLRREVATQLEKVLRLRNGESAREDVLFPQIAPAPQ
ncbi:MAG TPA: DUF309 domain-containing protein [Thermoplasmata archaeon]|nr:DUF309 domain-containing protein [Thermoplasmata archaeon]